jgi:glycosyltransferase involved in cell wall biosynthesis
VRESISSLLQQTYPGRMSVILVDDQSLDQTVVAALDASQNLSATMVIFSFEISGNHHSLRR